MRHVNIAAHLPEMARSRPHQAAVVFPWRRDSYGRPAYTLYNFQQLNRASDELAHGLTAVGIGFGTRTALMVKPSLEFFALTFALFKLGAVPVLIDPGMGLKSLRQCLIEAEPQAFIGTSPAHAARLLLRWPRIRIRVTAGKRWFWGGSTLRQIQRLGQNEAAFEMAPTRASDMAAILFTSGSTGAPKGAIYTHGIFIAQVELLKQIYTINPGEIDLCTFPLFALFAPALGMTAIIPEMDFTRPGQADPLKLIEAIQTFGCTNMFGSPALLNRLGRFAANRALRLETLNRVICAGAPVQAAILKKFTCVLRPGAQAFTPYGATESLPVCNIGSDEILTETMAATGAGAGICVGRPVPGVEVRIIAISDGPIETWSDELVLAQGQVGEITVKGPVVTSGYYHRESSTRLAKILDVDGAVRHRMGDLGYFDPAGRLWFCGRKSHRVQTAKATLFTIMVEGIFNTHPEVFRTALVGLGARGQQLPVLCVELEEAKTEREKTRIRDELLKIGANHAQTRIISDILFHPGFPVDIRHNAKIFREKLASWATTNRR